MTKANDKTLVMDIGASGIKVAEFAFAPDGSAKLTQFAVASYEEELNENNRYFMISQTAARLCQENNFNTRRTLLSVSGQFALTRFVKLPPVSEQEGKVQQIVEFEARQNVPFPIEEVVWDYQLIANPEGDEMEVMFVVIKKEIVEEITSAVQSVGLQPVLLDISPCATYNAARANKIGDEQCEIVLDIGCRSTSLMFVDSHQLFTRTIPIAGNTITQQIAKELDVSLSEAEDIKMRYGFVGLGGAYEDPASEVAAAVSKIIRGVMTRLHGEINRSITLYRSQQKGAKPNRLLLTGGATQQAYTDNFFAEKLGIEVEYFNPFKVISLAPDLDLEYIENHAHCFGPLLGLALRYRGSCPVEVNLLPSRIKQQLELSRKKPFFVGIAACIILLLCFSLAANMYQVKSYEPEVERLREERAEFEGLQSQINQAEEELNSITDKYGHMSNLLQRRERWVALMTNLESLAPDMLWIKELRPIFEGSQQLEESGGLRPPRRGPGTPFQYSREEQPRTRSLDEDRLPSEIETEEPGPRGRIIGLDLRGNSLVLDQASIGNGEMTGETDEALAVSPEEDEEELAMISANQENSDSEAVEEMAPERLFIAQMRQSRFFEDNDTSFDDFQVSDEIRNLRSFTIQTLLVDPIDLEY